MYNSTSIVGSAVLWIDDPPQVKGKIKYQKVTTLSLLPGQVTGKSSTAASSACRDLLNIWDEEQAKSFLFMLFFCYHDAEVTIRTQECLYLLSFTIPVAAQLRWRSWPCHLSWFVFNYNVSGSLQLLLLQFYNIY